MGKATPAYDAFISHASEDFDRAMEVCQSLESRGFRCWIAPRDIMVGRKYPDEIMRGIRQSRCLVVLISEHANQSDMVPREVERAVNYGKPVFPVRLQDVLPSPSLEFLISTTQWLDLWTGRLVEHMDRLAEDLRNDSLVASAQQASRKVARRRRLPRWIAVGVAFIALIGAVVAANVLSNRWGRSATADATGGEASRDLNWLNSQLDQLGVDLAKVTKDDFNVSVRPSDSGLDGWYTFTIKTSDKLASALQLMDKRIAIDDGPMRSVYALEFDQRDRTGTLPQAKSVSISFQSFPMTSNRIVTVGPFKYPITVPAQPVQSRRTRGRSAETGEQLLARLKQRLLDERVWLQCWGGGDGAFQSLRNVFPAVRRVSYGESKDRLNLSFELPHIAPDEAADALKNAGDSYMILHLPYRPGAAQLYAQVEFYDGSKSDLRPAQMPENRLGYGVELKPTRAPQSQVAPPLYASFNGTENLVFIPGVPVLGVESVQYAFDDGGMFDADVLSQSERPSSGAAGVARGFRFTGAIADTDVYLRFKRHDGSEAGPFVYHLDNAVNVAAGYYKNRLEEVLSDAVVAKRVNVKLPSDPADYGLAQKLAYVLGSQEGLWWKLEAPAVICRPGLVMDVNKHGHDKYPADADWAAVKEVRLGIAPGRLDVVKTPDLDWQSIATGHSYQRQRSGEPVWWASFPVETKELYAMLVYRDGTQSREMRVPIENVEVE